MIQEAKLNTFREETKSRGAHTTLHKGTELSRVNHLPPPSPPSWQQDISTMPRSRNVLTKEQ